MHKNFYHQGEKEKLRVEITPTKFLVIVATVMVFFVLPLQLSMLLDFNPLLENPQDVSTSEKIVSQDNKATGRVAGASDNRTTSNNDNVLYLGLGGFFILLSLGTIGYIFQLEKQTKLESLSKKY